MDSLAWINAHKYTKVEEGRTLFKTYLLHGERYLSEEKVLQNKYAYTPSKSFKFSLGEEKESPYSTPVKILLTPFTVVIDIVTAVAVIVIHNPGALAN